MRRLLLLGVATLLSASALLAVAILLFGGHFSETQGRILGSTAILAGYGILAIPAATLFDRRRALPLAALDAALAAGAALLALVAIWSGGDSETLGRSVGTVTVVLLGVAQTAVLTARRHHDDPRSVRLLFVASLVLAAAAIGIAGLLIWGDQASDTARVLGAVVVLDLLASSLQPILARARPPEQAAVRLRIRFESGTVVDTTEPGHDVANAVRDAIRRAELDGGRVAAVEIVRVGGTGAD